MARLTPLYSGSSGNSYYIGSRSAGLLLDAGRSARQLETMLKLCGVDPLAVQGILVTHEHTDHVSGLKVFAHRYRLPVYASSGTLRALGAALEGVETHPTEPGLSLAGMGITPFPVSHDCVEPQGYRVETEDGRVVTLATDLGLLTPEVKKYLLGADLVILESNHDIDLLRTGPYPPYLKRRILSDQGHLSNKACASVLPELLESGVRRFLLAHLSRENNTPSLAMEAALGALSRAGAVQDVDFLLETVPPENRQGHTVIF